MYHLVPVQSVRAMSFIKLPNLSANHVINYLIVQNAPQSRIAQSVPEILISQLMDYVNHAQF